MKKLWLVLVILMTVAALVSAGGKKEAAQLTVEIFDRGTDGGRSIAHDNAWTKWIKEKVKADLNIDVTFVPVGRWSENTDIVNLMASRTAPDLCYTYAGDMVADFRDRGGIMDLSPFINSHLPDLKKLLGEDPAFPGKDFIYRNADPQTGKIYSIPSYRVALAQRNIFIRKDWLDKLGLPVPTTIEEFENALKAFRDQDPGNVGRNRVVPYGQNADARWGLANLINHHIDPNISDKDRWVYSVHERNILMPGFKEGVRLMNRWYNEGLIYRDFPLQTVTDDFYNQIKTGVVGAFSQNWDLPWRQDYKLLEELRLNVPGAELVPVDIVRNKDMMDKVGLQMFIPSFSKNHEAALRYLNWLAKHENYHFLQVGRQGINHQLVNGVPNTMPPPPEHQEWFMNSGNNIDYTMPMNGVEMGSTEINSRVLALSYGATPPDVIVSAYAVSTKNARAAAVYQAVTKVNQYSADLQAKADALLAQAITARPADFDRIWDNGIADFLSSGAQEVVNERASLYK
ncbi:MAG: extracellular solute-binding protein [Treponema sp.]|jgi:putative aldouronate transport system substrate-binding protein|nr:extracellular solute-binding protein [Treponema sp.]